MYYRHALHWRTLYTAYIRVESAFVASKHTLTSEMLLCHFGPGAITILHTDVSSRGLQRERSSRERLVACAGRTLTPAERNCTVTEL